METAACRILELCCGPLRCYSLSGEGHKDPFEKNVFDSPGAGAVFLLYYRFQLHRTSDFDNFLKMKVSLCFAHLKPAVVMIGLLIFFF